jgi:dTDP-glucose 4,6-dehydratase
VADTVSGFIAGLESDRGLGEVINLGSNYEISIEDTVHLIAKLMHAEVEIENDEQRLRPEKSEVERLWADNKKAAELLNWHPDFSNLDGLSRGLEKTIEWFSDPKNLQIYKHGTYNI